MAIVSAEVQKIHALIQDDRLHIPEFQRPYKWTVRNVVQLVEDVERFKKQSPVPYRIGTVILWEEDGKHHIVDGQQRTVSFLLVCKAIIAEHQDTIQSPALQQQLRTLGEKMFAPRFKSEISKANIHKNYQEIVRRIATVDEAFIDFFLNHCEVTKLAIDEISEAFQFFDSQNARGKDLEPHDLLKAFHLRELNSPKPYLPEPQVARLVETWEEMETSKLAALFADFMYRVRGWCRGNSSRYFSKKDIHLFKGFNLRSGESYPYLEPIRIVDAYLSAPTAETAQYPFQLDAPIINGKYFFDMITHYKRLHDSLKKQFGTESIMANKILRTIDNYKGMSRTGDKYVRMLFNCAILYYYDKFGDKSLAKAIEKIFIWAYRLRLTYQNLQIATVDNYVVREEENVRNLFKIIRDANSVSDVLSLELPLIEPAAEYRSEQSDEIRKLFVEMRYVAHE